MLTLYLSPLLDMYNDEAISYAMSDRADRRSTRPLALNPAPSGWDEAYLVEHACLHNLKDVSVVIPCEEYSGSRYNSEALSYTYQGKISSRCWR